MPSVDIVAPIPEAGKKKLRASFSPQTAKSETDSQMALIKCVFQKARDLSTTLRRAFEDDQMNDGIIYQDHFTNKIFGVHAVNFNVRVVANGEYFGQPAQFERQR